MKNIFSIGIPFLFIVIIAWLSYCGCIDLTPGLIISFVTVLLTYVYVFLTWQMVKNMNQESELERRPYVIPDFDSKNHFVSFYVKNYGKTPAFGVQLFVTPDLKAWDKISMNQDIFHSPISIMPPGKEVRLVVGHAPDMHEKDQNKFDVRISYEGANEKKYEEIYSIDFSYRKQLPFIEMKDISDLVKQVEKINENLRKR